MSQTELKYRDNVAGILCNQQGRILICERLGVANAWQFPQGGVDPGEGPEEALTRELWEEIGVLPASYSIARRAGPYRYLFGDGRMKRGHHGKSQIHFLCDYHGPDSAIQVTTAEPEFQAYRWIEPKEFQLNWLPEMKHAVYAKVFAVFFKIKLGDGHESC